MPMRRRRLISFLSMPGQSGKYTRIMHRDGWNDVYRRLKPAAGHYAMVMATRNWHRKEVYSRRRHRLMPWYEDYHWWARATDYDQRAGGLPPGPAAMPSRAFSSAAALHGRSPIALLMDEYYWWHIVDSLHVAFSRIAMMDWCIISGSPGHYIRPDGESFTRGWFF